MFIMNCLTNIGEYKVILTSCEDVSMLPETVIKAISDIESGCLVEGWTPGTTDLASGLFAFDKHIEIYAYQIECKNEPDDNRDVVDESKGTATPYEITLDYLGICLNISTVMDNKDDYTQVVCYAVNGQSPVDVLPPGKLIDVIRQHFLDYVYRTLDISQIYVISDGKVRNFNQAAEYMEQLGKYHVTPKKPCAAAQNNPEQSGAAWFGWKKDDD